MTLLRSAVLSLSLSLVVGQTLNVPPQQPAAYPSIDESVMISGSFLQDPLVTQAVAYVKAKVSADVLAIPPTTYKSGSTTTYTNAYAEANCYWPYNLCVRSTDSANWKADISVCPAANTWGITYDDGPISNNGKNDTSALLTALKNTGVSATFFCVGSNVVQFPADVKAAYDAGHEIASHTWTHHPLTSLTNEQVVAEIKYTEAIIYKATGVVPALFRPPYGDIDDRVRAILTALGYRSVIWTTTPSRDTTDADGATTDKVGQQILATVKKDYFAAQAGFISLEHDISPFTTGVGIAILNAIQEARAAGTFPLTVTGVGKCTGLQIYQGASNPPSGGSGSTTTAGSGSATTTTPAAPTTTVSTTSSGATTAGSTSTSTSHQSADQSAATTTHEPHDSPGRKNEAGMYMAAAAGLIGLAAGLA
ncbi:chitin deacetylase [Rhizophlyctis rosea]|nr:chitin deacetylase [Rhizophlyctis rosea]